MSRLAVKLEWLEKDPFINFKLRFEKTERQFLTERELQLIEEATFKVSSTQQIKDLFIFACYTGLSFIDVQELKADHLVKGMDGNDWLYTKRTKTDASRMWTYRDFEFRRHQKYCQYFIDSTNSTTILFGRYQ